MTLLDKLTKVYLDAIHAGATDREADYLLIPVIQEQFALALHMITMHGVGPNAMGTLISALVKVYAASFDELLRLFPTINDSILHATFAAHYPNGYEALVKEGVLKLDTMTRSLAHVQYLKGKWKVKKQQLQTAETMNKQTTKRKRQPSFMNISSDERN